MIGKQLKFLREIKNKTQQDVCSELNIEQSTLANYENNKRIPDRKSTRLNSSHA